jgi:ornithine cyclodeaminase/alanine dehydrogenase-like protein (mu-crystallin family)
MTGGPGGLTTTVIGRDDVAAVIAAVGLDRLMDEMIEQLTTAIVGFDESVTSVRTRDGFHYSHPDTGLIEWMPVMQSGESTTIKVVGYHPGNPRSRQLPTILATISVYDTGTGHLRGLVDGTFLTAVRTGAASAVASRVLARPSSHILGVIGCGAQSVTQIHALVRTFPIDQVLVFDVDQAALESLPERIGRFLPPGVQVRAVPMELLMQTADIVCTATSIGIGEGPLFDDLATKPGLHVNAVGSDFEGKYELPVEFLRRALVSPDVLEQARMEGECQVLAAEEIGPSLAHVVAHPESYRGWRDDLTVFDSTGWALEDQVAAGVLMNHAARLGLGTAIAIEDIGADPLDPYHLAGGTDVRRDVDRRDAAHGGT